MSATYTAIQGQPGNFLKQEVVQAPDLDSAVIGYQKIIDDSTAGILDYQDRIAVLQGQISSATQTRDTLIALKTAPIIP